MTDSPAESPPLTHLGLKRLSVVSTCLSDSNTSECDLLYKWPYKSSPLLTLLLIGLVSRSGWSLSSCATVCLQEVKHSQLFYHIPASVRAALVFVEQRARVSASSRLNAFYRRGEAAPHRPQIRPQFSVCQQWNQ